MVTAICGASSAYGSHAERKTTRFSMQGRAGAPARRARGRLLVRRLELAQDLVAALDRVVQRYLCRLVAREHSFQLLLDHLAPLHEVAEAQPLGVRSRLLVGELLDRH